MLAVDDCLRRKWVSFLKTKDGIGEAADALFPWFKKKDIPITSMIIRCDNGGENVGPLKQAAEVMA